MLYMAVSLKTDYIMISMAVKDTFRELSNTMKEANMTLCKLWIYKPVLTSSNYGGENVGNVNQILSLFF